MFRVCEHYDDNQPISTYNYNYTDKSPVECFICFEYSTEEEVNPINLKNQKFYLKNCDCNASVHNECLKIWFHSNHNCPICRISVTENTQETIVYSYIPFGLPIYLFLKSKTREILKILSVILFLYATCDLIIIVMKTSNHVYEDHTYNL